MAIQLIEYPTRTNLKLRVARGHFATSHSHNNYYIDFAITILIKSRLNHNVIIEETLIYTAVIVTLRNNP